jgi:hypothetical protein
MLSEISGPRTIFAGRSGGTKEKTANERTYNIHFTIRSQYVLNSTYYYFTRIFYGFYSSQTLYEKRVQVFHNGEGMKHFFIFVQQLLYTYLLI